MLISATSERGREFVFNPAQGFPDDTDKLCLDLLE